MDKISRVDAAMRGDPVDRPPFTLWYHFGLQHTCAERVAQAHLEFFRAYQLDLLKVMNDYAYPTPNGLTMLQEACDWQRLTVLAGDEAELGKQLQVLRLISKDLAGEAYFVETVFSPWTVARRLSDTQTLLAMKAQQPDLLLEVMNTLAQSLANYAQQAIEAGAAGLYFSVTAANSTTMTYSEYEKFCRPFDLMVLNAVKERTKFNILHIHGQKIFFNQLLDYPVAALSWSHRHTEPTLETARSYYKGCLWGGIDEERFSHMNTLDVKRQIIQTVEDMGTNSLIIAPGCSVSPDSAVKLFNAVYATVQEYAQ